jgi:hypothetical protein
MACAKCDFYMPKQSTTALLLEGKEHLLRLLQEIPLGEAEQVAVEEGVVAYENLLSKLADVPTPAGPTPHQIGAELVQITSFRQVAMPVAQEQQRDRCPPNVRKCPRPPDCESSWHERLPAVMDGFAQRLLQGVVSSRREQEYFEPMPLPLRDGALLHRKGRVSILRSWHGAPWPLVDVARRSNIIVTGPMDLGKLAQQVIRPVVEALKLDWYGWHGFRRGIASNLYELGADEKVVQRILLVMQNRT